MSKSNLFIPKRIRVGFQKREGTYTKHLAYIVYYDNKGKLRKEKSWQGWRDKGIKAQEFENEPTEGFVLNKGIRRGGWSHFGSERSMIRIYDPRGMEFEITPENLLLILMETNCSKRGLEGEFVYAWMGTELILIPCVAEDYKTAQEYTDRQDQKVSARDLKPGCSYTTKKGEEIIYMGRFPWFEWNRDNNTGRVKKKSHVFCLPEKPDSKYGNNLRFFPQNNMTFLAELNNSNPVPNYADLVDEWNSDEHSSEIVDWKTRKILPRIQEVENNTLGPRPNRSTYYEKSGNEIHVWRLETAKQWGHRFNQNEILGYRLEHVFTFDTKTCTSKGIDRYWSNTGPILKKEQVLEKMKSFSEVDMVLSNGSKVRFGDRHYD